MQNPDFGALDEPEFEQSSLEFGRGQTVCALADLNCVNPPAETAICQTQRHTKGGYRRAVGHVTSTW